MSSTGTITAGGVGSGIDVDGLVTRLVAAEGSPKQAALASRQASVQAQISAYGSFRSALTQLQGALASLKDPAQFRSRSASVADDTIFSATATGDAAPGTYDIEVQRLASSAKLRSGPFAAATTVVGTGTLTLSLGTTSFAVTIDGTNSTLAGIRDAINRATDNPGISAALVTANDGLRLVLTSAATGAANAITVAQSGGDNGLAQLTYDPQSNTNGLTQLQAAEDARITVDGIDYDSASNTVTGALDGVTLTLRATTAPATPDRLTIAVDRTKPQAAVNAFVTAYNQVLTGLRRLGAYDAATKQGGTLLADPVLRGFLARVRAEVGGASAQLAGNAYTAAADIGVTTNLDGTLKVDATRLAAAFTDNADAVARLFSGDGGIAKRLDAIVTTYSAAGGLLDARTQGLQTTLDDLGRRKVALERSLAAYEARLRAQFTAMDTLVAQLKQTGQNLVAQLDSLKIG
jgi:flagellar hook-associated protein 2